MDTPSDRVQMRERGELRHPGICALCGNGTCVEGYVDLDIYFEYEGNVYLCMNCALQVAHVIGCLLPKESRYLEELNNEIATKCKSLEEKLDGYQKFDNLIAEFFGHSINTASDDPVSDPPVEESESEPDTVNEPTSDGSGEKPVSVKSGPKRRPNDASRSKRSNSAGLHI